MSVWLKKLKEKQKNHTQKKPDERKIIDFSFDDIWDADKQISKLSWEELFKILLRNIDNIRDVSLNLAVALNTFCDSLEILGEILEKKN